MRLLFLTSRLPFPPNRGDRTRVFNFIRTLSADHEIDLISFISRESECVHRRQVLSFCRAVHLVRIPPIQSALSAVFNAWRDLPLQVSYYRSQAMRRTIDAVVGASSFDAVYVHLFRMAPYAEHLRDAYRIVDLTDVISQEIKRSLPYRSLPSRILYAIEQPRIERYERLVAGACDEVWMVAERERRALAAACPEANVRVVPCGVDAGLFHPTEADDGMCRLLFVGNMCVPHNVDAAVYLVQDILPRVRAQLPDVRLTIAGADPVRVVRMLEKNPAVTVTGYVPDLNGLLNQTSVFVAPLRFGAGVQNKVIEAMAAGRPVVTTRLVNDGLRATPGRDLLVADDPGDLAGHIVTLCRDPLRRRQLGAQARRFVTRHYRWSCVSDRMRAIQEANTNPDAFRKDSSAPGAG